MDVEIGVDVVVGSSVESIVGSVVGSVSPLTTLVVKSAKQNSTRKYFFIVRIEFLLQSSQHFTLRNVLRLNGNQQESRLYNRCKPTRLITTIMIYANCSPFDP